MPQLKHPFGVLQYHRTYRDDFHMFREYGVSLGKSLTVGTLLVDRS